jgi:hypothetical protein
MFLGEHDSRKSITEGLGLGGVLGADPWLGGHPGEGRSLIGVHNGLPTFVAALIWARRLGGIVRWEPAVAAAGRSVQ